MKFEVLASDIAYDEARVAALSIDICAIYEVLAAAADLSPDIPEVYNAMDELVSIARGAAGTNEGEALINRAEIKRILPDLRYLGGVAETIREKITAAEYIAKGDLNFEDMAGFCYFDVYVSQILNEASLLPDFDLSAKQHIVFLGGGAMPMSAYVMASKFGWQVDVIDRDEEAISLSGRLTNMLGLQDNITIRNMDARDVELAQYDVVWVAAMIDDKAACLKGLEAGDGENIPILIRGAEGACRLLYARPDDAELGKIGLRPVSQTAFSNKVINTTYLYQSI